MEEGTANTEGRTSLKAQTPVLEGPAQVLQMWSPGKQMLLETIVFGRDYGTSLSRAFCLLSHTAF